ncbi:hypothetical protein MAHJHV53_44690 [Mycobacterium avium subsp. hominissuis]
MTWTDAPTARWNRYSDKPSRNYDREMGFFGRHDPGCACPAAEFPNPSTAYRRHTSQVHRDSQS